MAGDSDALQSLQERLTAYEAKLRDWERREYSWRAAAKAYQNRIQHLYDVIQHEAEAVTNSCAECTCPESNCLASYLAGVATRLRAALTKW